MPDELRITDLGLAAFLRCHGHDPSRLEMINQRSAAWVFASSDDGISDLVDDYHDRCAEVEPREFMGVLADTRRDLFEFLDKQTA